MLKQSSSYKAQDAVIKLKEEKLREMINAQKGFSGYAAGQLAGNGSSSLIEKADEAIGNTLISSGNSEMLNKWETFKGNATAAWENTKDIFQDTVEDIGSFVSDKSNTVSKFITENTDQLNVDTDTFKVVKDVYKDYRKQGIDINQYDMENYIDQQGASAFFDRLDNSTMVDGDMYPNGVFLTEREANVAYAQEANNITINDDRETGTVIIKVPVTMKDEKGNEYTVNMYTNDDIYEGMHGNVITGTAARVAAYSMDPFNPIPVSVTHTHPKDAWNNKFSRGLISDELVARWPTVENMYVADVDTGSLLKFNESMPSTLNKLEVSNEDYKASDYEIVILPNETLPYIP